MWLSENVRVFLLTGAVFLAGLGVSDRVEAGAVKGQTARATLPQAMQLARKWQVDAFLVMVASIQVEQDGRATGNAYQGGGWGYTFYSPKTRKSYAVNIGGGEVLTTEVEVDKTQPIPPDFVDSNRALDEAKRNGFRSTGPISMGLGPETGPGIKPGIYWSVVDSKTFTVFYIDPKIGKFVAKVGR